MKPEIKEKWIAALRSGEYEQGQHVLKGKTGKFCCLGVLCDIAQKEGATSIVKVDGDGDTVYGDSNSAYFHSATSLPLEVTEWSGMETELGMLPKPIEENTSLVSLNDSGQYTFSQIADIIEEQF